MHEPGWSKRFETKGMALSFLLFALDFASPVLGSILHSTKLNSNNPVVKFLVAIAVPIYHLQFSLAVGFFIMLAATGFGSKFINGILSHRMWKPFARLSLCAILVNIEVISYFVLTSHRSLYIDNESLTWLNLVSIVGTYSVSIVLCVLFEAPIRAALNQLVVNASSKLSKKPKSSDVP